MKNITLFFLSIITFAINAQDKSSKIDIYRSSESEMIFSFSQITQDNESVKSGMRYTWWYNVHSYVNFDFNNTFGIYTGLGLKNIGFGTGADSVYFHGDKKFFYKDSQVNKLEKVKQRTYSLGIPVGLKIGNFKKNYYFFLGGEYEYAFHYKEKVWVDGNKKKYSEWFGTEITTFLPTVFVGFKFPNYTAVKFTWYLDNFVNQNHNAQLYIDDNTPRTNIKPFAGTNVQVFYVSVSFVFDKKLQQSLEKGTPKLDM